MSAHLKNQHIHFKDILRGDWAGHVIVVFFKVLVIEHLTVESNTQCTCLGCQWSWGPAKALLCAANCFQRSALSCCTSTHLTGVSGSQRDSWAALYLTMSFLSDSVGTWRWWEFKSISQWCYLLFSEKTKSRSYIESAACLVCCAR